MIIGKANRTAVATLVERASRHTLVVPLPDGYSAPATARAVSEALARQPAHMAKTPTWDKGREMTRWAHIEKGLAITVYFCEPRSPWQRPTNEQTNGLLRRWLPKSTDLNIGPVGLAVIEDNLNTMPRRIHNWNTAQTIYSCPQLQPPIELARGLPSLNEFRQAVDQGFYLLAPTPSESGD